ncbi:MAG: ParB/RepB/Spo0J family partition protein [Clostridia bacterium]|nr:ParB/RepB/Spo0J family partition protein [Clostridia bacterium]
MKTTKRRKIFDTSFTRKVVPVSLIDTEKSADDFDKKQLKARSAYFMLNGEPEFSVNEKADGRFFLLASERDFFALKATGTKQLQVRVYAFTDKNAECFSVLERLKTEKLGAMDEGYLMKRLIAEFGFTQDDIASLIGKSRPAVANTLRLLTLAPEVVGLVESGKLSAGHARALVKVPKEKQYAFAQESIKREYTVREMERAVKAYLTPPEVLQRESEAKAQAKSAELKAFVERMRGVFRTKVSLIGNDKKGRIYIDYYSAEDLYRFEEFLDMIESYNP